MDGIVMAKLVNDVEKGCEKEEGENVGAAGGEERGMGSQAEGQDRGVHGSGGMPVVRFESGGGGGGGGGDNAGGENKDKTVGDKKAARVKADCRVRDLRERIKNMKKWRRELERSVTWQREEYRRIEKAMGRKRGEGIERGQGSNASSKDDGIDDGTEKRKEVEHEAAWGVGGRTWEKGRYAEGRVVGKVRKLTFVVYSGRIPTKFEWEVMFSPDRIGWDEKGVRKPS